MASINAKPSDVPVLTIPSFNNPNSLSGLVSALSLQYFTDIINAELNYGFNMSIQQNFSSTLFLDMLALSVQR